MEAGEEVSVPRPSSPPKDPAVRRKCFDPNSIEKEPMHPHIFIHFFLHSGVPGLMWSESGL
jgi:hypothetical protein